jgi:hypothetical protein
MRVGRVEDQQLAHFPSLVAVPVDISPGLHFDDLNVVGDSGQDDSTGEYLKSASLFWGVTAD